MAKKIFDGQPSVKETEELTSHSAYLDELERLDNLVDDGNYLEFYDPYRAANRISPYADFEAETTGLESDEINPRLSEEDIEFMQENNIFDATPEELEEIRANRQSGFWDLAYRGPVRTLNKALSETMKMVGTIGGAIGYLSEGFANVVTGDRDEAGNQWDEGWLFNNKFNTAVDDITNAINETSGRLGLKVHIPEKVKEGDILDNLGNSAFWGTEGADGVGFLASMLVPGALAKGAGVGVRTAGLIGKSTKATNLLGKLQNGIGKLSRLGKGSVTSNLKNLIKTLDIGTDAEKMLAVSMKKLANGIDMGLANAVNTTFESLAEGSGAYQNVYQQMLDKGWDKDIAKDIAADRGSAVFRSNIPILLASNAVTLPMLFGSNKASKSLLQKVFDSPPTKSRSLANFVNGLKINIPRVGSQVLKSAASEGLWEEGMQFAAEHYYTHSPEDVKTTDKNIWQDIGGVAESYVRNLGNIGMQKGMALGVVLGGLMGGKGAVNEYKNARKTVEGTTGVQGPIKKKINELTKGRIFKKVPPTKGLRTYINELNADKQTKDEVVADYVNTLLHDSLIKHELSVGDVLETTEDGNLALDPENGLKFKLNSTKALELGQDLGLAIAQIESLNEAYKENDSDLVRHIQTMGQYQTMQHFLDSDASVELFKQEVLPHMAEIQVKRENETFNEENNPTKEEVIKEKTDQRIEELSKQIDIFKAIKDRVDDNHQFQMFSKDNKNPEEYTAFSNKVRNRKIQDLLTIANAENEFLKIQEENNEILSKPTTTIRTITKREDGTFPLGNNIVKYNNSLYKSDSDHLAAKIKEDKPESLEVIESANSSDLNQLKLNTERQEGFRNITGYSNNVLESLYNKEYLKKAYNKQLVKSQNAKKVVDFNKKVKENDILEDGNGDLFKIRRDENGKLGLYKGKVNDKGIQTFSDVVEPDLNLNNYENTVGQLSPVTNDAQNPITGVEYEQIQNDFIPFINDQNKEQVKNMLQDIKERDGDAFNALRDWVINSWQGINNIDITDELNKTGLDYDGTAYDPTDSKQNVNFDIPDINITTGSEKVYSSAKKSYQIVPRSTAGSTTEGRSDQLNKNPNQRRFFRFTNKFNFTDGRFKLKIIKATDLPIDKVYFDKKVGNAYDYNNNLYSVVVDAKTGEYVDEDGNILENQSLSEQNVPNKDLVYTSLPEAITKTKTADFKNETRFYTDYTTEELLNMFNTNNPDEAKTLLEQDINKTFQEWDATRKNIFNKLNRGEEVIFNIEGKGKGIIIDQGFESDVVLNKLSNQNRSKFSLVSELNLIVATENKTNIGGEVFPTQKGQTFVYDTITGNLVPTEVRNVGDINIEGKNLKNTIIDLFRYYVNNINNQINDPEVQKVDIKTAAKVLNKEGRNIIDKETNKPLDIFKIISDLVYYTGNNLDTSNNPINTNEKTKFHYIKTREFGGVFKLGEFQYPLLKENLQGFQINPEFESALNSYLSNRFHQIRNVKLQNPTETITIPSNINLKDNYVEVKPYNYKEYLLGNVITTNIAPPVKKVIEQDEFFGPTEVEEFSPVYANQYLIYDYSNYIPTDFDDIGGENGVIGEEVLEEGKTVKEASEEYSPPVIGSISLQDIGETQFPPDVLNEITQEIEESDEIEDVGDLSDFLRRVVKKQNIIKEDLKQAETWFNDKFPESISFNAMKGLVDKGVYGYFKDNAVYIANEAEVGTTYHEAFHVISQLFLTPGQQRSLYNEWRENNKGKNVKTYDGVEKLGQDFTNKEVEEALAEDFRDFVMSNGQIKFTQPRKQNFFQRLWNFIQRMLLGPRTTIDNIFDKIQKGDYKYAPHNRKSTGTIYRHTTFDVKDENGLVDTQRNSEFFKQEVMDSTDVFFFDAIRKRYGVYETFFSNSNEPILLQTIYGDVEAKYRALLNKHFSNPKKRADYRAILSQFENGRFYEIHANRLKSRYGIEIQDEENLNVGTLENEKGKDTGWDMADKSVTIDFKKNASRSTQFMLKSLPELIGPNKVKLNSLGLPKVVNYSTTFSVLLDAMQGIKTLPELLEVIDKYKNDIPSLNHLYDQRMLDLNKLRTDDTNEVPDHSEYPVSKFLEGIQFTQTFAKAKNNYLINLGEEGGNVRTLNANNESKKQNVRREWSSNANDAAKNSSSNPQYNKDKTYNTEYFKRFNPFSELNKANDFLKLLGIELTNPQNLSDKQVSQLITIANSTLKRLQSGTQPNIWNRNEVSNMSRDINKLIAMEYDTTIERFEQSHLGIGGESLYNYSNHSYYSRIIDSINKAKTLTELYETYPHLNPKYNSNIRNSLWLKPGGYLFDEDGRNRNYVNGIKKNNILFDFNIDEGLQESDSGAVTEFQDLKPADRFRIIYNHYIGSTNADGIKTNRFNVLRPADKKLERFIEMNQILVDQDNYKEVYLDYLKDELNTFKDNYNTPQKWKNFKNDGILMDMVTKGLKIKGVIEQNNENLYNDKLEILNDLISSDQSVQDFFDFHNSELYREAIETYFIDLLENEDTGLKQELLDSGIIEFSNALGKYINYGLKGETDLTANELNGMLLNFLVADSAMNIEQTKVFTGHPAYFKDVDTFFKRTGSYPGTTKLMIDDIFTNNYIRKNIKRVDGHIELSDNGKAIERSLIVNDPIVNNKELGYFGVEESDGFSLITMDAWREMLVRTGDWSFGEGSLEDLYQYEMQNYYSDILSPDQFKSIFNHKWQGKVKDPRTGRVIENSGNYIVNSLKPLYVGPYANVDGHKPAIYKTSFGVMLPSMMKSLREKGKNTNMEEMMEYMRKNQIGILSFYSANKGGTSKLNSDGSITNLYNEDGNLNIEGFDASVKQDIFYEFLGIQVDTGNKNKRKVIVGTQMMKQVINSLSDKGQTQEWASDLVTEYKQLNDQRIELGKEILLNDLSITKVGNDYKVNNLSKVQEVLRKEAVSRDLTDNVILQIDSLSEDFGIDGLLNREKFEQILFALADSTSIRQKRYGSASYQFAPTLFEIGARRDYNDGKMSSSDLKFYSKGENKTSEMEVYLPDIYKDLVSAKTGSKDLLSIIGFRIPTQGLNSIDAIKIKGFLPKEAGDIVVLPSEIVKKAGSDYDIDKMQLYFPNVYQIGNKFKYIKEEEYVDYVSNMAKQMLKSDFLNAVKELDERLVNEFLSEINSNLSKGTVTDLANIINDSVINFINNANKRGVVLESEAVDEVWTEILNGFNEKNLPIISETEFNKKAIENRISEIQRDLILAPENFDTLTKPLDSPLLPDLASDIYGLYNKGESRDAATYSDISNRVFLNKVADRFAQGKASVGITALYSTFHIQSQQNDVFINDLYKYQDIKTKDTIVVLTKINMSHNESNNGIALGGLKDADNNQDISYLFNLWMSAAVDAAKDPFMFDMNVNLQTLNTVLYLTMAGVPIKDIVYFVNQPIIREYIKQQNKWESSLMETTKGADGKTRKKFRNEIVVETLNQFGYNFTKDKPLHQSLNYENAIDYSNEFEALIKTYNNGARNREFAVKQRNILSDFIRYQDTAKIVNSGIQGINYDTAGPGKNIGELNKRLQATELAATSHVNGVPVIGNYRKIFESDQGFIAPYFREVKNLKEEYSSLISLLKDEGFMNSLNFIIKKYQNDIKSLPKKRMDKIIEKLINDYISFQMINNPYIIETYEAEDKNEKNTLKKKYSDLVKGRNTIAKKLQNLQQNTKYKNNTVVQKLIPIFRDGDYSNEHVILSNRKMDKIEMDQFTKDWDALLYNPETKDFAIELMFLTIGQSTIAQSPINFTNLAPANLYIELFTSTMNAYRNLPETMQMKLAQEFLVEFPIQNFKNNDLVKRTTKNLEETGEISKVVERTDKINEELSKIKGKEAKSKYLAEQAMKGVMVYKPMPRIKIAKTDIPIEDFYQDNRNGRVSSFYTTNKLNLSEHFSSNEYLKRFNINNDKLTNNINESLSEIQPEIVEATTFESLVDFTQQRKEEILDNFVKKHKVDRQTAINNINVGLARDKDAAIKKLKECY